jgi:hypothetical protein
MKWHRSHLPRVNELKKMPNVDVSALRPHLSVAGVRADVQLILVIT